MTEMHLMVAMFERCGHEVEIIPDPCGFWVEVENIFHQRVRFIFNQKAQYCGMCPLELQSARALVKKLSKNFIKKY